MIKNPRLWLALWCAVNSAPLLAISLGPLEIYSTLGQPLDAEIRLTDVGNHALRKIEVGLADKKDYVESGIARDHLLTDLQFKVKNDDQGHPVVHITSSRPMTEPLMQFIVTASWGSGRSVETYHHLIPRPVFPRETHRRNPRQATGHLNGQPFVYVPPAHEERKDIIRADREIIEIPPSGPSTSLAVTGEPPTTGASIKTQPGDTLWGIARRRARSNPAVPLQKIMHVIYEANPTAFINGSMDQLKANHVLHFPGTIVANENLEPAPSPDLIERSSFEPPSTDLSATDTQGIANLQAEMAEIRGLVEEVRQTGLVTNGRLVTMEEQIKTLTAQVIENKDRIAEIAAIVEGRRNRIEKLPTVHPVDDGQRLPSERESVDGSDGSLLSDPKTWVGIGIFIVTTLVGALLVYRRRQPAMDSQEYSGESHGRVHSGENDAIPEMNGNAPREEPPASLVDDMLDQAEGQLRLGMVDKALEILENTMAAAPDRADIRVKLLEIYTQTNNVDSFREQLGQLASMDDEDALNQAMALQAKLYGTPYANEPEKEVYDFGEVTPEAASGGPASTEIPKATDIDQQAMANADGDPWNDPPITLPPEQVANPEYPGDVEPPPNMPNVPDANDGGEPPDVVKLPPGVPAVDEAEYDAALKARRPGAAQPDPVPADDNPEETMSVAMAKAYYDMGHETAAVAMLESIILQGDPVLVTEAEELLNQIRE